jgi:hypothetical protein
MVVPSVIAPDVVWIELVVDADAQDLVGDAGIEGSGPRIRGRRCDGEDRAKEARNKRPLPTRLALTAHAIGFLPRLAQIVWIKFGVDTGWTM